MEYILKVLGTQPEERHFVEGDEQVVERQIAVSFAIFAKNGSVVATEPVMKRSIGFSVDATTEEIKAELAAQLKTYQDDMAAVVRSAKAEEFNANAVQVAKDLDGLEI
jgi:hypothetical protein